MDNKKEWFHNWFDTPFYHILYDYRNDAEAHHFMRNLNGFLNLAQGSRILDLPCGKGRHSLFLNKEGFTVTGADLSPNSIEYAKKYNRRDLNFEIHDMRDPLSEKYDAIFNLFTSFGYFNHEETNIKVLKNFKDALQKNGHVVIDFLNLHKVIKEIVPVQQFTKKGIHFNIRKEVSNNFILKKIEVNVDTDTHHFIEQVQALDLNKFKEFCKISGLEIEHVFGDYELKAFDKNHSERLILILR